MSLKDNILAYFESNRGKAVSGQALAEQLNVSRNSVWKTIQQLRDEGYHIESSTNRGYIFAVDNRVISAVGILKALGQNCQGIELRVLDSVDSTNNEAKRMLAQGFSGTAAILAKQQTSGRGRRNKTFFSPESGSIYLTMILQNHSTSASAISMTMAAAVAVCRAIETTCVSKSSIKWVNDVYVADKKVCGILTEGITNLETGAIESIAVGIGVNVGPMELPSELRDIATAVELRPEYSSNDLAAQIIQNVLQLNMLDLPAGESETAHIALVNEYRSRSMVIGRDVSYSDEFGTQKVHIEDIDNDGGLIVIDAAGQRKTLRAGEISIKL